MKAKSLVLAVFLTAALTSGAPSAAFAQVEVIRVQVAPPTPQVEVIPAAPSVNHFWVGGHWHWDGARYVWNPGHWDVRREGFVWSPAHWVQEASGTWLYRPGQFVAVGAPAGVAPGVVVQTAPPAPPVEVITAPPGNGYHWVPGHWTWTGGRYAWVGGHWRQARLGYYWVPSHWARSGAGWVFVEGYYHAY